MSLATVIAGISGFVVIIVAARAFGSSPEGIAMAEEFTAYWGLFFAGTGVLTGLTQETTRAVAKGSRENSTAKGSAVPVKVAAFVALATVAVCLLSVPLWLDRILSSNQPQGAWLLALGLGSYAIQATVAGVLSANQLWPQYAALITMDTSSRMVFALGAWLLGWKLLAFIIVTVMGAVSWILLLAISRPARSAFYSLADVPTRAFLRRAGTAMAASGATAVLITGFPTIVRFTHPDTSGEAIAAAAIIYAVTLTRAPILVPLQQFQSALIVRFVEKRSLSALAQPLGLVWAVGILGAGLAWVIGPWLMVTILGPAYDVPGRTLALLTLGAACTASLMVTGAATVALDKHNLYLSGWILATIVAVAALSMPWSLSVASCVALSAGPAAGLAVHALGLRGDIDTAGRG